MAKKKELVGNDIGIQFVGCEILSSEINRLNTPLTEVPQYNFNIQIENKVDEVNKIIHTIVSIAITSIDLTVTYGSISVNNMYNVLNLEQHITKADNGVIVLPKYLTDMVNSISLSTTRGVMFGLFRGTTLHFAFLPIIDPNKFQYNPTI